MDAKLRGMVDLSEDQCVVSQVPLLTSDEHRLPSAVFTL